MLKFEPEVNLVIEIWDGDILHFLFTNPPDNDIAADVKEIANNTGINAVTGEAHDELFTLVVGEDVVPGQHEDKFFSFLVAKCHNIKRIARELAVYFKEQHGLKVKTEDCRRDPEGQYERTFIYR